MLGPVQQEPPSAASAPYLPNLPDTLPLVPTPIRMPHVYTPRLTSAHKEKVLYLEMKAKNLPVLSAGGPHPSRAAAADPGAHRPGGLLLPLALLPLLQIMLLVLVLLLMLLLPLPLPAAADHAAGVVPGMGLLLGNELLLGDAVT